ncbi:unnamed protein product, partial [Mesorhabditis belari]|uniref:C2 domain-containing protein n=1 Tax=Mesorhabditis belari TaxID=2138241 RepID=A0AAF3EGZ3_9BILA
MRRASDEFEEQVAKMVLTISARDLRDTDLESVSDPFCVVSVMTMGPITTKKWKELGRTEVINNCLNPDWATKIQLTYAFEEQQKLLFEVFDWEKAGKSTRLGSAMVLLHEIVGAKYNRVTVPLVRSFSSTREDGKRYGSITVTAEEMGSGRQESVYFMCSATKLDRKDFLGKCDPFLKISRINWDNTFQLAYRSRYREQNLNPKWKPFEVHIDQLCYGDKNRAFLIECYDWDQDGNHDLVGSCTTTVNRLVSGEDVSLSLIHEKKARKSRKYVDSGQLHFHRVYCWLDFTFLDFVHEGTELDFTVAVDFASSNLTPDDPSSLHRIEPGTANQYETAIRAIGEICQFYNASKVFNGFGFAARLPNSDQTLYNFPLNVETGEPRCDGVEGLFRSYRTALRHVVLSGPTDFAPTIRFAAQRAASLPANGSKYCVLLILTNGIISDMERTKEQIVKASGLPLSIIIVGVGYDSFEEMKVLDSDNQLLSWHGKFAKRDIVQFVQMRNFLPPHRHLSEEELTEARQQLAKEVLQEIPMQLTSYMKSRGIYPLSYRNQGDLHSSQMQYSRSSAESSTTSSPNFSPRHTTVERRISPLARIGSAQPSGRTPRNPIHGYTDSPPLSAPPLTNAQRFESPSRVRRRLPQVPSDQLNQMHIY